MSTLNYKSLWLVIGYLMVGFIVYSSLTSSPVSVDVKFSDKILHVIGYFGVMGWFMQIYHGQNYRLALALAFIVMGISLEFLQDLGGVRYFEFNDMLANTLGVLLAWSLYKTPFPFLLSWVEQKILKVA